MAALKQKEAPVGARTPISSPIAIIALALALGMVSVAAFLSIYVDVVLRPPWSVVGCDVSTH